LTDEAVVVEIFGNFHTKDWVTLAQKLPGRTERGTRPVKVRMINGEPLTPGQQSTLRQTVMRKTGVTIDELTVDL